MNPPGLQQSGTPTGRHVASAGLAAVSSVVLLAAVAAAGGSFYDESASRCGSLLAPGSGPDCSAHRSDRLWLVFVTGGAGLVMLTLAFFPPWRARRTLRSPAVMTATIGLLAPGVQAALIVLFRHAWGPVGEEYTGMPDVWAPVALAAGVLVVCLAAGATGLRDAWCLPVAAVAVPVVALIQTLTLDLAVSGHGVAQPARLPLVYPVGQEHPLALATSGVAVAGLLAAARFGQGRVPAPARVLGLALFISTCAVVTALLVIDASPDVFLFAPLGHWVWAPLLSASALTASVVIAVATRQQARRIDLE